MDLIIEKIAQELTVSIKQVSATVKLLDDGNTVPFIARYRKEITGGLNDCQLRLLVERLDYLRELTTRKESIIKSISLQGKLTEELQQAILIADSKARLEDLYRPYKPKRRTKGQIAIEAGLKPLAEMLCKNPKVIPEEVAKDFINVEKGIDDLNAALNGASYILMEEFADDPELNSKLREKLWQDGILTSKVIEEKKDEGKNFANYFDFAEKISKIPSHRALAILRGRREGILRVTLASAENYTSLIAEHFAIKNLNCPADLWLLEVVRRTWQIKLYVQLEIDLLTRMRELAEKQAIKVFANNLKDLLMTPPAGSKVTMGLDPGLRTGVKVAITDPTGKPVDCYTIYPHAPKQQWQEAIAKLAHSCLMHKVQLIAIGNGTGSRETEQLINDLIKQYSDLNLTKIIVSEAGASVYSASEIAAHEFPELDVTLRGAISIARRLQDPLAELVKIEPKSIGVGQYQHDVDQTQLARELDAVVEDCVNSVGVDVNTASQQLLARVAGVSPSIAANIVAYRNQHGAFGSREDFKKVTRFGTKAFEQAAGFLRIANGNDPLDASSVHPEAYSVVQAILHKSNLKIQELIGNQGVLAKINPAAFITAQFGLPTILDVITELHKPGRDPRPQFKYAQFDPNIAELKDLTPGMLLEGIVTNVADFGAFVDLGVHQDGLIHVSALADKFIRDPREVLKTGDIVTVKVMSVDVERQRVSLSMKSTDLMSPALRDKKQPVTHAVSFNNGSPPARG